MHALMLAGAMVRGGLHDDVLVVAGGSLAKLGMKFQGHVKHAMPIVEDVLAGFAVQVSRDGGVFWRSLPFELPDVLAVAWLD